MLNESDYENYGFMALTARTNEWKVLNIKITARRDSMNYLNSDHIKDLFTEPIKQLAMRNFNRSDQTPGSSACLAMEILQYKWPGWALYTAKEEDAHNGWQ